MYRKISNSRFRNLSRSSAQSVVKPRSKMSELFPSSTKHFKNTDYYVIVYLPGRPRITAFQLHRKKKMAYLGKIKLGEIIMLKQRRNSRQYCYVAAIFETLQEAEECFEKSTTQFLRALDASLRVEKIMTSSNELERGNSMQRMIQKNQELKIRCENESPPLKFPPNPIESDDSSSQEITDSETESDSDNDYGLNMEINYCKNCRDKRNGDSQNILNRTDVSEQSTTKKSVDDFEDSEGVSEDDDDEDDDPDYEPAEKNDEDNETYLSDDEDEEHQRETTNIQNGMMQIGANGTKISRKEYDKIKWDSAKFSVPLRQLMRKIFTRETLATHSMTGKPSPAFVGRNQPARPQLDPKKLADIIELISSKYNNPYSQVRLAITTALADARKTFNRRNRFQ